MARALAYGQTRAHRLQRYLAGTLSALLVLPLVVILGLILQLLVERGSSELPQDWVLGPWVQGRLLAWPFFGSQEWCLAALVGSGLVVSLLLALTLIWFYRLVAQAAARGAGQLKTAIHQQAFRLGPSDLLGPGRSRPEELFNDKTELVRQGLLAWWMAVPRSAVGLGALILLALAVNFWLTLLALLLAAGVWQLFAGFKARAEQQQRQWQDRAALQHARLLEDLRLARLATGYGLDHQAGQNFQDSLQQYQLAAWRAAASGNTLGPRLLLTVLLSTAFLLLVVGLSPGVTVAGSVVLGTALICAYFPAARIYRLSGELEEAERAAAEIWAFLDREPSVSQLPDARPLDRLQREVRLENVTLADRNGGKLLDHVSVRFPAGHRIALLASDPQTPLALAGLFIRFYDPAAGQILFDGHDIRRATLDTVRGQALWVPANGPLFTGTVWDNINSTDTGFTTLQVTDAARQARAYEFIQQLPEGLSTRIGEHGLNLRPAQPFHIGLARALLHQPSLLVVEEPGDNLEEAAARQLDEALLQAAAKRTLVLLPARLATLRSADCVYLFHQGKLHAQGKHAELLQSNELYRHLNYVRFNPFRGVGL